MRVSIIAAACVVVVGACTLSRSGLWETDAASSTGAASTSSSGGAPSVSSSVATGGSAGTGVTPTGGSGGTPTPLDCSSSDLIACYRFEGDVVDDSPHTHDLVAQGTLQHTAGIDGQAVVIAGDTTLTTPPTPEWVSGAVTLELWVFPATLPRGRAGLVDANCCYSIFLYGDGQIRCDAGGTQVFGGQVPSGAWTHVACVHDGSSVTAYVNGTSVGTASAGVLTAVNVDIGVGLNTPELDARLDGYIDSVRVWSIGLSAQQICEAAGC